MSLSSSQYRQARKRRVRSRVHGTAERPRCTVFRSLTHMSVQLIDDDAGKTLAAASPKELKKKADMDGAKALGEAIAKKAKSAKVDTILFDRNGYKYHGRVKALADAAREAGLTF